MTQERHLADKRLEAMRPAMAMYNLERENARLRAIVDALRADMRRIDSLLRKSQGRVERFWDPLVQAKMLAEAPRLDELPHFLRLDAQAAVRRATCGLPLVIVDRLQWDAVTAWCDDRKRMGCLPGVQDSGEWEGHPAVLLCDTSTWLVFVSEKDA